MKQRQNKQEEPTISKDLRSNITEEEISEEIKKVSEEFKNDNDIIVVTERYFRYRPKKVTLPVSEGPIYEIGYTEERRPYRTDGTYAGYRHESTIDPGVYTDDHFKAVENLEKRVESSKSLHDKLVLWYYNWMTVYVLYERSFVIDFGTVGMHYLVDNPEDILPLTKEALDSRTLLGDPRMILENRIDHVDYSLLKEIRKVDEPTMKKVLENARKDAMKIRVKELKKST